MQLPPEVWLWGCSCGCGGVQSCLAALSAAGMRASPPPMRPSLPRSTPLPPARKGSTQGEARCLPLCTLAGGAAAGNARLPERRTPSARGLCRCLPPPWCLCGPPLGVSPACPAVYHLGAHVYCPCAAAGTRTCTTLCPWTSSRPPWPRWCPAATSSRWAPVLVRGEKEEAGRWE